MTTKILVNKSADDARAIAQWLNDNVSPGNCFKPSEVIIIAQTLVWRSDDLKSWIVSHTQFNHSIRVTGVPDDEETLFMLRFS